MSNNIYNEIRNLQRENAAKSLGFFASTYFKHYCKVDFAKFHLELFNYLQEMTFRRDRRFALAAPRGYAKSTIVSLIYVLWCICLGFEKCIVIFSSTKDQSEKLLTHIKDELSSNEELKRDFPDVCEPPNPRWRNDEIITKNGVNVIVSSVGHKIRGIRHKQERPGLVVLDDVETIESIRTEEGRDKLLDWFTKVVLNLGSDKTNFIVTGTILHLDSLLAKLITQEDFAGWDTAKYKAIISEPDHNDLWEQCMQVFRSKAYLNNDIGPQAAEKFYLANKEEMDKGAKVLWPKKESLYQLMTLREQIGEASFSAEKQNEPRDVGGVDLNTCSFWNTDPSITSETIAVSLKPHLVVLGACDPAVRRTFRSDYSAIVTAYLNPVTKELYVIDADMGRWDLKTLVERICMYHKTRNYSTFVYEANAAQAWLGDEIKKQSTLVPLKPITNTIPKEARIARLLLLIQQGKVHLSKRHPELLKQIAYYPNIAHDDLIDALSMLIDIADGYDSLDIKKMKLLLEKCNNPYADKNPKAIIAVGRMPFHDPFGLFAAP